MLKRKRKQFVQKTVEDEERKCYTEDRDSKSTTPRNWKEISIFLLPSKHVSLAFIYVGWFFPFVSSTVTLVPVLYYIVSSSHIEIERDWIETDSYFLPLLWFPILCNDYALKENEDEGKKRREWMNKIPGEDWIFSFLSWLDFLAYYTLIFNLSFILSFVWNVRLSFCQEWEESFTSVSCTGFDFLSFSSWCCIPFEHHSIVTKKGMWEISPRFRRWC